MLSSDSTFGILSGAKDLSADLANLRAQLEEQKRITLELEFGKGVVVSLDLTKEIRKAEKEKSYFDRQL